MVKSQIVLTLSEGHHVQLEDSFGKQVFVFVIQPVLQGSYELLLSSCPQNKAKVFSVETLTTFANALDTLTVTSLAIGQSYKHFLLNLCFSAEQ